MPYKINPITGQLDYYERVVPEPEPEPEPESEPTEFSDDFEKGWLIWNDFGDPIFTEAFDLADWLSWLNFGSPVFIENFENGGW